MYGMQCVQIFYKPNLKPKTIPKLKRALQQIRYDLPQTFAILSECALAGVEQFKPQIWTFSKNILLDQLSCFCICNIPAICAF